MAEWGITMTVSDAAHLLSDVRYDHDTEPTASQLESARRALKRLERDGVLASEWEPVDGPPGRRLVYRLKEPRP